MAVACTLAQRGLARTNPNPNVGCVLVKGERIVGRGWTGSSGRPHAEERALAQAGEAARGATAYVTLEPCAHHSTRGPTCSKALIAAKITRLVVALEDPDPRTSGKSLARLRDANIAVTLGVGKAAARAAMAPWLSRIERERPFVTLKLALSIDACLALGDGSSRWISGERARVFSHMERARHDAILVGRGTLEADSPRLDVRVAGLEKYSPKRLLLTRRAAGASGWAAPSGWIAVGSVKACEQIAGVNSLLVEGGAGAATAFLCADRVDRLLIFRAPIMIGGGKAIDDIGLRDLSHSHGRWRLLDSRMLGYDRMEIYERTEKV